jgi:TolB-like protein/Tfp pilus assembly protein PilF
MSALFPEVERFLEELRRRKVYRAAAGYAAFAFIIIQVADLLLPAFEMSGEVYRLVVITVLLGFPVIVVLAWVFELSPGGVRITRSTVKDQGHPGRASKRQVALELVIAIVAISGAVAASWYLVGARVSEPMNSDRSLAVLPFTSANADEQGPFSVGIHNDLLTRLSDIRELSVIARSSVERYRGSDKASSEIASELGVRWILEGTVQHVGEQVRVSTSLIDPVPGVQIWSDSYLYDLTAANLFAVQAEIAQQIADALHTRLTPEEKRNVGAKPTDNLDAYRLVVEARTLLALREEPQMRRALALFRQATELDPKYALAWVGIADSLYELFDYGFEMPEDSVDQAMRAAELALQLEPDNAEALVSFGIVRYLQHDGLGSMRHFEHAIELRPGYAEAFSKVSWVAQILGRPVLAAESAKTSIELDPLAAESRVNYALTRLLQGDGQLALATLQSDSELVQDWPTIRFYEGVVLHHLGHHEDAIAVLEGLSIPWAGHGPLATEALAQVASGNADAALSILSEMEESGAHPFLIGLVYAGLGDQATAFGLFESVDSWSTDADWSILAARYLYPDVLDSMRSDPRYDRMLREIDRAWGMVM